MRVEAVPPARPVVRVADLRQPRRVALLDESACDDAVVRAVLLGGAAREGDGDRRVGGGAAQQRADEARDPLPARERRLLLVGARPEEAARLQQQAVERLRMA